MSRFKVAAAAIAALMSLSPGRAQAQTKSTTNDIVVTGSRVEEMAQAYAGAVALAPTAADQYARWNFRLCPSVAGLAPAAAQTLIDHIARRAHEVGVDTERTGCQPNLVIIFAPEPERLAREIVNTRRDLLGYYTEDDVITAGRAALDDFVSTPRAVRWWHVSRTTTADGQQLGNSRTRIGRGTGDAAGQSDAGVNTEALMQGNGFEGSEAVRSQGTRTRRATRQDLSFALVIVDAPRAASAPSQAVADYLAMATLVQLDPHANMSAFPTVLNLFAERPASEAPPVGMTAWDLAYLEGLYSAEREAASARQQRDNIARHIASDVRTR